MVGARLPGFRRFATFGVFAALACALGPACAKEEGRGFFQEQDFAPPKGKEGSEPPEPLVFDRNNVIETATLVDVEALSADQIQAFFHRTPYDRPTFLETYQSNGVRASDAVARAARTYHINPLAILVAVQGTQGLIGETLYPTADPYRVEYVFRCGCQQGLNCEPELAGFDRQVDCLARNLRAAFDQIASDDATAAGWAKDKESLTLDNVKVVPENDGTAVVYDRSPRVAEGGPGGTWFFWNLFNVYATAGNYRPPTGDTSGVGWIGDKCASPASCSFEGALCEENRCTQRCTGMCPSQSDKPSTFCADHTDSAGKHFGLCLPVCNPTAASSCRKGFQCVRLKPFDTAGSSESTPVCTVK